MLASIVELAHHNLEQGTRSLRAARAAGVPIALGSDRDGVSGDDSALELLRTIHHGLTPHEALQSATAVAAQACGLEQYIGYGPAPRRGRRSCTPASSSYSLIALISPAASP